MLAACNVLEARSYFHVLVFAQNFLHCYAASSQSPYAAALVKLLLPKIARNAASSQSRRARAQVRKRNALDLQWSSGALLKCGVVIRCSAFVICRALPHHLLHASACVAWHPTIHRAGSYRKSNQKPVPLHCYRCAAAEGVVGSKSL
eukprot:1158412-Pelagomonas_calceolata.AAC.2